MKTSTTILLVLIALVLGVAALFAVPPEIEPEAFSDQGEIFFPDFNDPLVCKELELFEPDPETATVKCFNIRFDRGLWRIPSHHGYPADAKDRMANAAASLIGLKMDKVCSIRVEDRTKFGVEDPRDDAATMEGRGKCIVLKDGSGRTLAEAIVGHSVEGRRDWAYIRKPDSKRIYAVNLKASKESPGGELLNAISSTFNEWIDTDLLHMERNSVKKAVFHNYSVDEETRSIDEEEVLTLTKNKDEKWTLPDLGDDEQIKEDTIRTFTNSLDSLLIAGVRPTPEPLSQLSLASKGFFLNGEGQLFGNKGHIEISCNDGVNYFLFFGEILFGTGESITAGMEKKPGKEEMSEKETVTVENRYLFVRVGIDPDLENEAAAAQEDAGADETAITEEKSEAEKKKEELDTMLEEARKRVEELNLRFEKWYYVISGESFNKLRMKRFDLTEPKELDSSDNGEEKETPFDENP